MQHGSNTLRSRMTKGGKPHGGARGPMSGAIFRPGTPFVVRRVDGVAHAKSGDEYLCIQTREI